MTVSVIGTVVDLIVTVDLETVIGVLTGTGVLTAMVIVIEDLVTVTGALVGTETGALVGTETEALVAIETGALVAETGALVAIETGTGDSAAIETAGMEIETEALEIETEIETGVMVVSEMTVMEVRTIKYIRMPLCLICLIHYNFIPFISKSSLILLLLIRCNIYPTSYTVCILFKIVNI